MRKNVTWMFAALAVLSSMSSIALAGPDAGGSPDPNEHGRHGRHGGHHADDADDDDDDDGGAPAVTRTPAQEAKRKATIDERRAAMEAAVHKNGKDVTNAERMAIGLHWRHVMRLLRIREIAENAGDKATVARVDTLLARATKHFDDKIAKLNAEAPGAGAGAAATDGGSK